MRQQVFLGILILTLVSILGRDAGTSTTDRFDLAILGGRVVDGTGNPWFEADIGITDGKIAEIGRIDPASARERIYAQGLVVAPGFIDVHTHIEASIEQHRSAENFLMMGVTSVITGNCGSSAANLDEWFAKIGETGIGVNIASMIGHNTVRREAMGGDFSRPPRPDELNRMRDMVAQAMKDGAIGFSTGLRHIPGNWAGTDEIVELARIAGSAGGVFAAELRDDSEFIEKSLAEVISIGERTGCPVEISQFRISGRKRWGASAAAVRLIEEARAKGIRVTVDQNVYPAMSDGIEALFPFWVFDGGRTRLEERLINQATRQQIRREVIGKAVARGFDDLSFAYVANYNADSSFNGRHLAEIAQRVKGRSDVAAQADLAIDILLAGGASMVLKQISDADLDNIFRQPFTMIASDAEPGPPEDKSVPHPGGFGNNARVLGVYVRQRKIVSLAEAIRRMTSLPAQTFGIWDRGLIRPGMAADLVIFDALAIRDLATFEYPGRYPLGVEYVILNGKTAVEKAQPRQNRYGVILRRAGAGPGLYTGAPSAEQRLRIRDDSILRRFNHLKRGKQASLIDRRQYLEALRALLVDELKLFDDARNTRFNDITEHEYWHRGRLKFPSPVAQEIAIEEVRQ